MVDSRKNRFVQKFEPERERVEDGTDDVVLGRV